MSSLPLFKRKKASAWSRTKLNRVPKKTKVEKIMAIQASPSHMKKAEVKYLDTGSTGSLNTTGATLLLNGIAEGDDNTNREGRQVLIQSVQVKGTLTCTATGETNLGEIRIFWHKDPLGSTPSTASWFQGSNISSLTFNNIDNEDSVICLAVIKIGLVATPGPTQTRGLLTIDGEETGILDKFYRINLPSRFNNTTGISPVHGGLYAVYCGSAASGINNIAFNLSYRVRFRDL